MGSAEKKTELSVTAFSERWGKMPKKQKSWGGGWLALEEKESDCKSSFCLCVCVLILYTTAYLDGVLLSIAPGFFCLAICFFLQSCLCLALLAIILCFVFFCLVVL